MMNMFFACNQHIKRKTILIFKQINVEFDIASLLFDFFEILWMIKFYLYSMYIWIEFKTNLSHDWKWNDAWSMYVQFCWRRWNSCVKRTCKYCIFTRSRIEYTCLTICQNSKVDHFEHSTWNICTINTHFENEKIFFFSYMNQFFIFSFSHVEISNFACFWYTQRALNLRQFEKNSLYQFFVFFFSIVCLHWMYATFEWIVDEICWCFKASFDCMQNTNSI